MILLYLLSDISLFCQQESNNTESEFLPDRSDITQALNAKTFQVQAGISFLQTEFDSSNSKQFALPLLIGRYGITDNFGFQVSSEFDLNKIYVNEAIVNQEYQISYILMGLLFQPTQHKRIIFFDNIAFLFDYLIPLISSINNYSEIDVVFTTNLSERFSLEYSLGYSYQKNSGSNTNLSIQFEAYLTKSINCAFNYINTTYRENDIKTRQNSLAFEIDFLTDSAYQIDFTYTYGLSNQSSYVNGVFIYTF